MGVGIPAPRASLGTMIQAARSQIFRASVSDADSDSSAVYPDTVAESDRGRTGSKNPQKKGRNVR